MKQKTTKQLFVYGTLQRGFGLNNMLDPCKYLGTATVKGYQLKGGYSIPFAVRKKNSVIKGEVYEMTDEFIIHHLLDVDAIEGAYHRVKTKAKLEGQTPFKVYDKLTDVFIYEYRYDSKDLVDIPNGDFREWREQIEWEAEKQCDCGKKLEDYEEVFCGRCE